MTPSATVFSQTNVSNNLDNSFEGMSVYTNRVKPINVIPVRFLQQKQNKMNQPSTNFLIEDISELPGGYVEADTNANFSFYSKILEVSYFGKFAVVNLKEGLNTITKGWRASLKEEIKETYSSRTSLGWDGYDAEPITEESVKNASLFIDALPEDLINPEIIPGSDGFINFEWDNNGKTFS